MYLGLLALKLKLVYETKFLVFIGASDFLVYGSKKKLSNF